ncbi:MAG: phosphoribosylanthranilate isomerase [Roseburia sp.]|nr:phosphoribosylanthranilate isomerase [Roseburia sp.]
MAKIKLCGLKRACEIEWVNELKPDYVGFVFSKKSRRYVNPGEAGKLKAMLHSSIKAVGVFVDAKPEVIAGMAELEVIDAVQLHGSEDEAYLRELKRRIKIPVFQAFRITSAEDVKRAEVSSADMVLLDAGAGCGEVFDWNLLKDMKRPYFLAGGLTPENVSQAIKSLRPYGVDASSSLETEGLKDSIKMAAFVEAVRGKEE